MDPIAPRDVALLLDHGPVALLTLDSQGAITAAAGAALRPLESYGPLVGWRLADLLDDPTALVGPWPRRVRVSNPAAQVVLDSSAQVVAPSQLRGGHAWWDLTCRQVPNGMQVLVVDVTTQVDAQEARDQVLARARCIFWTATLETAGTGVRWDLQIVNESAGQSLVPLVLAPGQGWGEAWYHSRLAEDLPTMHQTARDALIKGLPGYQQVFRCRAADGSIRWLQEDVEITTLGAGRWYLTGICTDVTARQQAQLALANQNEHLRRGLLLARDIQIGLLPQNMPVISERIAIHARSLPAAEVGGDFYIYQPFKGGRVGLAIGDVSGKGIGAALMMALASSAVEAEARTDTAPQTLLARLNAQLLPRLRSNHMHTGLLYAVIDPLAGTMDVANGGMIAPILLRDGVAELTDVSGLPLGAISAPRYLQRRVMLRPGDRVVLASDGVVEARDGMGRLFGFERLEEAFARHAAADLEALLDALLAEVAAFTGPAEQADDITILVIELR